MKAECLQLLGKSLGLQCQGCGSEEDGREGKEKTSFISSPIFTKCLPWAGHSSRSLMEKQVSSEGTVG